MLLMGTTAGAESLLTIVPGAGTGQMQPYVSPGHSGSVVVVEPLRDDPWVDYMARSRARAHQAQQDRIEQKLDDIETEMDDGDD